jgi:hypothetical protein
MLIESRTGLTPKIGYESSFSLGKEIERARWDALKLLSESYRGMLGLHPRLNSTRKLEEHRKYKCKSFCHQQSELDWAYPRKVWITALKITK